MVVRSTGAHETQNKPLSMRKRTTQRTQTKQNERQNWPYHRTWLPVFGTKGTFDEVKLLYATSFTGDFCSGWIQGGCAFRAAYIRHSTKREGKVNVARARAEKRLSELSIRRHKARTAF